MKLFILMLILMTTQMVVDVEYKKVMKKSKTVKKVLITHQMTMTQNGINSKIL